MSGSDAAGPHLVITDSGFGGLSLLARLERALSAARRGARLSYVNACPSDELGYNAMESEARRVRTFGNVLGAIEAALRPDAVIVACNTLSALLPAAAPAAGAELTGILGAGVELIAGALAAERERPVLALATGITARARAFDAGLAARGLCAARLRYRACPGLETELSNDAAGHAVRGRLLRIAEEARGERPAALLLGCTHYSHRPGWFAAAFAAAGAPLPVLDPVAQLAEALAARWVPRGRPGGALEVQFLTRYAPPRREVDTYVALLAGDAPRSAAALARYRCVPDLFAVAPPEAPAPRPLPCGRGSVSRSKPNRER